MLCKYFIYLIVSSIFCYMAYVIQYDGQIENRYKKSTCDRLLAKKLLFAIAFVATVLLLMIPKVRMTLFEMLVPGNSAVTTHAAHELVTDLKDGQAFKEAFGDFCVEILENP